MANVKLDPIVEQLRGQVGGLAFRNMGGQTVLSRKPDLSGAKIIERRAVPREHTRRAVLYGRTVLADAEARMLYEGVAAQKGKPAFSLIVADFLNAPSIDEVDLSAYGGKVGDRITIRACDEFSVTRVRVSLADENGSEIESGEACEVPPGSDSWVYFATRPVSTGSTVRIDVTASDGLKRVAETVNSTQFSPY